MKSFAEQGYSLLSFRTGCAGVKQECENTVAHLRNDDFCILFLKKDEKNNATVKITGNLKKELKYGLPRKTWEPD